MQGHVYRHYFKAPPYKTLINYSGEESNLNEFSQLFSHISTSPIKISIEMTITQVFILKKLANLF